MRIVHFVFRCGEKVYNTSILASTSVIICFHEHEKLAHLLHTVHSVVQRTSPQILKEIILIDDNSKLGMYCIMYYVLFQYTMFVPLQGKVNNQNHLQYNVLMCNEIELKYGDLNLNLRGFQGCPQELRKCCPS